MAETNPAQRFFKLPGPGLITGTSDDDPSWIGTLIRTEHDHCRRGHRRHRCVNQPVCPVSIGVPVSSVGLILRCKSSAYRPSSYLLEDRVLIFRHPHHVVIEIRQRVHAPARIDYPGLRLPDEEAETLPPASRLPGREPEAHFEREQMIARGAERTEHLTGRRLGT